MSLPKKYRSADSTSVLIQSAYNIKVKRLKRYKKEHIAIKEQERNYVDPVTRLTMDNKKLMDDVMRYEYTVTNLVLSKTNTEELNQQLEDELSRTKISLKEKEEINSQLEEETLSVSFCICLHYSFMHRLHLLFVFYDKTFIHNLTRFV